MIRFKKSKIGGLAMSLVGLSACFAGDFSRTSQTGNFAFQGSESLSLGAETNPYIYSTVVEGGVQVHRCLNDSGEAGLNTTLGVCSLIQGANHNLNLLSADLKGTTIRFADLKGSQLSAAELNHATLEHSKLVNVNLNSSDLRYAKMTNVDFFASGVASNLVAVDLRYAVMDDAFLMGVLGSSMRVNDAEIKNSHFGNASLSQAEFRSSRITNTSFAGANLTQVSFRKLSTATRFNGVDLRNANATSTDFKYILVQSEDDASGSYIPTRVSGATFNQAKFCYADLRGVIDADDANWTGARYNNSTKFPPGFVPGANGMVYSFSCP